MNKEQILELVKNQINKISISEFVAEGGFPIFSDLDILVYNQYKEGDSEIVIADILYDLEFAGCCFIPGRNQKYPLRKKITITNNQLEFTDHE